MTNTGILGDGGSVEVPMLGRYQVEKELGKGAMGVVHLGKDQKIGRVVAIRAMASMGRQMFRISSEPPTSILSINPKVPAGIVAFLDRAMEKEPDNRFQTGEEFAAAMRTSASGAAQSAYKAATSGAEIQL
jgi:serine/threonine protein kinase